MKLLNHVPRAKSVGKLAYKILFHVKSLKASVEFIHPKFFILKISPDQWSVHRDADKTIRQLLLRTMYSANARENRVTSRWQSHSLCWKRRPRRHGGALAYIRDVHWPYGKVIRTSSGRFSAWIVKKWIFLEWKIKDGSNQHLLWVI